MENSRIVKMTIQELSESQSNNTDLNNTDSIQFSSKPLRLYRDNGLHTEQNRRDAMDATEQYKSLIEEN